MLCRRGIVALLCIALHALPYSVMSQSRTDSTALDANRITVKLDNKGGLFTNSNRAIGGAFWDGSDSWINVIVYDRGLWDIGKMNDSVQLALVQWGSSYGPGPIRNGQPALYSHPEDAPRYRPYKISRSTLSQSNPDYAQWPADLGAPINADGTPRLYGDQTIWMVYNGLDTNQTHFDWIGSKSLPRLPVEVQQTVFAHEGTQCDSIPILANVSFDEWVIVNRGLSTIDSAYVSLWTDIDFNDAGDNRPAVDTLLQLGYCWQSYPNALPFGSPKAVGYVLLCGPSVPDPNATAIFRGRTRPGFRNLPLTSFASVGDDGVGEFWPIDGNAYTVQNAWNIARGLDLKGNIIIDSSTMRPTRYPYSGDPVTNTGWIHPRTHLGGGAGFYLFSGPFTLAPNDTQWVMVALVPASGRTNLESIQVLRQHAAALRSMPYDSLLNSSFPHTVCVEEPMPTTPTLFQNYPNPFNSGTVIQFYLPTPSLTKLEVFDLLGRRLFTLIDGQRGAGMQGVRFDASGIASGVYFYRLQAGGHTQTKKLVVVR